MRLTRGWPHAGMVLAALAAAWSGGPLPAAPPGGRPAERRAAHGFTLPDGPTFQQLEDQLPEGAVIAPIPTAYRLRRGRDRRDRVIPALYAFAILRGDVDGDGQDEFVVGAYFPAESGRGPRDERARLVVFEREGSRWKRAWTSPGLGYQFDGPRNNVIEVESGIDAVEHLQPPVALVDLMGNGQLAIAYFAWSESTELGALPGVYRWNGTRWRNVAPQADRFSIRDVDRDGRMEVVAGTRYIGYGSGDDDVPRVYRWNRDEFEEASRLFPSFYRRLAQAYRGHVERLEEGKVMFRRDVWQRAIQKAEALATPPTAEETGE